MSTTPQTQEGQSITPTQTALLDVIALIRASTRENYYQHLNQFIERISPTVTPTFEHVVGSPYTNEELSQIFNNFQSQISVNTLEIRYLNILLAKLIFVLSEQGIDIDDKELLDEMKEYLITR